MRGFLSPPHGRSHLFIDRCSVTFPSLTFEKPRMVKLFRTPLPGSLLHYYITQAPSRFSGGTVLHHVHGSFFPVFRPFPYDTSILQALPSFLPCYLSLIRCVYFADNTDMSTADLPDILFDEASLLELLPLPVPTGMRSSSSYRTKNSLFDIIARNSQQTSTSKALPPAIIDAT